TGLVNTYTTLDQVPSACGLSNWLMTEPRPRTINVKTPSSVPYGMPRQHSAATTMQKVRLLRCLMQKAARNFSSPMMIINTNIANPMPPKNQPINAGGG